MVIAALLTVFLVGSAMHFALNKGMPRMHWVKDSSRPAKEKLAKVKGISKTKARTIEKFYRQEGR